MLHHVLAATGRVPNIDQIGIERTSLPTNSRAMLDYDPLSGRVGSSNIFVAGDAAFELPLLHEAADEGRIAGENAGRFPDSYRRARRTPIAVMSEDERIAVGGSGRESSRVVAL